MPILGDMRVAGFSIGGSVQLQPQVQNGVLQMHVVRAKFGLLPVPGDIGRLAEAPINSHLGRSTGESLSTRGPGGRTWPATALPHR